MKIEIVKLYDIAESKLYGTEDTEYTIPNIQRGLVWKPIQIELIWDSILRGFPIGALLVINKKDAPKEILDGQQRANAIVTGASLTELLSESSPKAVLWYDLSSNPSTINKEKRTFEIFLTNKAHPWGFDYEGKKLSAEDRRGSLAKAFGNDIPPKQEWDIRRFIPYFKYKNTDAFLPIPLPILVDAARQKDFKASVLDGIKRFSEKSPFWKDNYQKAAEETIGRLSDDCKLVKTFRRLNTYEIAVNFINVEADIEVLFNRVNTMGTNMTNDELSYAALKHYGAELCHCEKIGEIIKEKADKHMPEQTLAQIAMRYCMSIDEIKGFISASDIRGEVEKSGVNEKLKKLFACDGADLKHLVEAAGSVIRKISENDYLPAYIEADIAANNTNLYILLLNLIGKVDSDSNFSFIRALIFYLHLFSDSNYWPIKLIFQIPSERLDKTSIQNILRDSISAGYLYPLIYSFQNFKALDDAEFSKGWNMESYAQEREYKIFSKLFPYDGNNSEYSPSRFMLKYVQRDLYAKIFGDYNPSSREYWEDINRPWDHDHIIPQSWGDKMTDEWKPLVRRWINCTGNMADIPFEENRLKRDKADWGYYEKVIGEYPDNPLFFDRDIIEIKKDYIEKGVEHEIRKFISITKRRFLLMSDEFLKLFNALDIEGQLSPAQEVRKELVKLMRDYLGWNIYYTHDLNGKYYLLTDDCNDKWQSRWMVLMKKAASDSAEAITMSHKLNGNKVILVVERGLRKPADKTVYDMDGGLWKNYYKIEL